MSMEDKIDKIIDSLENITILLRSIFELMEEKEESATDYMKRKK